VSNVRQQVERDFGTLLRLCCSTVEQLGSEMVEDSTKLSEDFETLSEIQEMCQDLMESSELAKVSLLTTFENL
jgi:hypothetical protein